MRSTMSDRFSAFGEYDESIFTPPDDISSTFNKLWWQSVP